MIAPYFMFGPFNVYNYFLSPIFRRGNQMENRLLPVGATIIRFKVKDQCKSALNLTMLYQRTPPCCDSDMPWLTNPNFS